MGPRLFLPNPALMSGYWDALERELSNSFDPADAANRIITKGWAPENNRAALTELLTEHWETYIEDPDDDWDYYCQCGKWLERDNYEQPDHQSSILEDTELLATGQPWATDA